VKHAEKDIMLLDNIIPLDSEDSMWTLIPHASQTQTAALVKVILYIFYSCHMFLL